MRARFAVDWDDTLVEDRYPDQGPWLPGAVEALRGLERLGTVVIFSCRVSPYEWPAADVAENDTPRDTGAVTFEVWRMKKMLRDAGFHRIEVWTRPYKPPAAVYIDNRAVRFTGDWEETMKAVLDAIAPISPRGWRFVPSEHRHPEGDESKWDPSWLRLDYVEGHVAVAPCDDVRCPCETDEKCSFDDNEPLTLSSPPLSPHPRHPGSQRFHDILAELGELHDRKQQDYGKDNDPFANVRGSSEWGVDSWVGAMIRATDKIRRLQTFAAKGELANESVIDAFDDLAVYAVIARVLYEQEMGS